MLKNEVEQRISEIKKGTFLHIEYKSEKVINGQVLTKKSKGVYRIGINYANLKSKKNKVVGELPWGQWIKGFETYLIEHTPKGATEPKTYLRIYTTDTVKSIVTYFLNGVERTKEWLLANGFLKPKKAEHTDCFVVPIENVEQLG